MLVLRNQFNEFERLFNSFNSLYTPVISNSYQMDNDPAVNVYENGESVKVVAELPGVEKDNISISSENERLTISGQWETDDELTRSERRSGEFETVIQIPSKVENDSISAELKNGILTITLPKTAEVKPKQIEING